MIEPFSLALPTAVRFGAGVSADLPGIVAGLGSRPLVLTGSSPQRHQPLLDAVQRDVDAVTVLAGSGEPQVADADRAAAAAREAGVDVVLTIGGGSVIDLGKAVAMLVGNDGQALDYLEVVGAGQPISKPSLPHVAVPTTAGAGAEVTANAVLMAPENDLKASLRSPSMIPTLALVDPALTRSAPPDVVAAAGMDALTQCVEPFLSRFANPVTDAWAREGIQRAAASLRRAVLDPDDQARADMSLCALLGGLSLANAKLGAVHGFAGPLGGMVDVPHGVACAALLGPVLATTVSVLDERDPQNPARARLDEVGALLTGRSDATARDAVTWVEETTTALGIGGLQTYGLTEDLVDEAVEKAERASSMRGHPLTLTVEELTEIARMAM